VKLLDWLVLRRFVGAYLAFASIVVVIFVLADLFTHVDRFTPEPGQSIVVATAIHYAAIIPETYYLFAPFVSLIAGMWVVASLSRSNELIPLMAAGVRPLRIVAPIFVAASALGAVMWVDREAVIPALSDVRRDDFARKEHRLGSPVPDRAGGILSARWYWTKGRRLLEARYTILDPAGREVLSAIAGKADPEPGGWRMREGVLVQAGDPDVIKRIDAKDGWLLETDITPTDVECAIEDLQMLSSAQLRQQIARMPGMRFLEVQLARRIAWPAAGIVLLLLGLPFVLEQGRGGGPLGLIVCIGICALFFVANALFEDMGARPGGLSPVVAAWLANGVFGAAGGVAFARARV
jgi:lipopolysaccharide export system permease protein